MSNVSPLTDDAFDIHNWVTTGTSWSLTLSGTTSQLNASVGPSDEIFVEPAADESSPGFYSGTTTLSGGLFTLTFAQGVDFPEETGTSSQSIRIDIFAATPVVEPASTALVLGGLAAVALVRRRFLR